MENEGAMSRRTFVKAAGAMGVLAGMGSLAGCASGEGDASEGASTQSASVDNTVSDEVEDLNLVVHGA